VRLDNVTSTGYGASQPNVLAVRVDGSFGSGHWYEGAGIYRGVQLVRAPALHAVEGGLFASPEVSVEHGSPTIVPVQVEVENFGNASANAHVTFALQPVGGGAPIATANATAVVPSSSTTAAGSVVPWSSWRPPTTIISAQLSVPAGGLSPWSVRDPTGLYEVVATVSTASSAGAGDIDTVVEEVGFRTVAATLDEGLSLNGEGFKLRGFSHHNSFTQIGTALSPRFELYRV